MGLGAPFLVALALTSPLVPKGAFVSGRTHQKVKLVGEHLKPRAQPTSSVRTQVLFGGVTGVKGSCDDAFQAFDAAFFAPLPSAHADAMGGVGCSETEDGAVIDFNVAVEARSEGEQSYVDAYLAAVNGTRLWGHELAYKKVWAVLAQDEMSFVLENSANGTWSVVHEQRALRLYDNLGILAGWLEKSSAAMADPDMSVTLQVIDWLYGSSAYVRETVLPEVNLIWYMPQLSFILEDRRIVPSAMAFLGGVKDCRDRPTRRCG